MATKVSEGCSDIALTRLQKELKEDLVYSIYISLIMLHYNRLWYSKLCYIYIYVYNMYIYIL